MEPETLYEQATALIAAARGSEALPLLMQVVRANPRHEPAWIALATVVDDLDKAMDCLRYVLQLNPQNEQAREWLAFAEREQARDAALAEIRAETDSPEHAVPRLGKYLLDYGFIARAQLEEALLAQREARQTGINRRLGEILLEQGAISAERLERALSEQWQTFNSMFRD